MVKKKFENIDWKKYYTEYRNGKTPTQISKEIGCCMSVVRRYFILNKFELKEAGFAIKENNKYIADGKFKINTYGRKLIRVKGKWKNYARYLWEKEYGNIPKNHDIHHINEDFTDDRIENLECIEHKKHMSEHANINFGQGGKNG